MSWITTRKNVQDLSPTRHGPNIFRQHRALNRGWSEEAIPESVLGPLIDFSGPEM
jgi:hypothetical protein